MFLLKIALRNIIRHKNKTAVIGIILFVGGIILSIGSASVTSMQKNVIESMVNKFYGNLTIMSTNQTDENVMDQYFGEGVALITDVPKIKKVLDTEIDVQGYLPYALRFMLMLSSGNNAIGYPPGCVVFACDIAAYNKLFNNVVTLEGNMPKPGERGLYLSSFMRNMYFDLNQELYYPIDNPTNIAEISTNHLPTNLAPEDLSNVDVKNNIVLMGISTKNAPLDVRVPIKGVFKYQVLDNFYEEFSLLDIDSYRQCMNYNLQGVNEKAKLTKAEEKLLNLSEESLENLFEDNFIINISTTSSVNLQAAFKTKSGNNAEEQTNAKPKNIDEGVFELIAVKLTSDSKTPQVIKSLNEKFKQAGLPVKAVHWKIAGGQLVSFISSVKAILYILISFIFVVAIIVIMNTLAMSTLERSSELGMIRALGAQKSFMAKMLLSETFILSFLFGGLGILCGTVIVGVINLIEPTVTNRFLQIITGGTKYKPITTFGDIIAGLVFLGFVTLISVVYPLIISRKITALDALKN